MNKTWLQMRRSLVLLAMGGSTFGLFGGTFGPEGFACNYARFGDYETLFTDMGDAVIQTVSDNVFGDIGTDYDTIVRTPTTDFAQSVWGNWVSAHVPQDLPSNAIVLR